MADLSTVSTRDLQAELARREGVSTLTLGPYERVKVTDYGGGLVEMYSDRREFTIVGPATITVNID
ncbi:BC1881 family protein [Paenibacillus sp. FSL W8-0426]|uniref:BC1881 family protein n=1 Tax=Paenibacillus sp. FSL W8-0426 TaxID=2921714 RepID=UPI0030D87FC7